MTEFPSRYLDGNQVLRTARLDPTSLLPVKEDRDLTPEAAAACPPKSWTSGLSLLIGVLVSQRLRRFTH